ncbi:uncharacterized protein LOC114727369 isoform X2 [Neltuma alba]|uniref:uncharacterized protein LOC114727369 isoform X2 n=1 Tax=Neltuma alba TaxID=207710 RepID=UPI0010A55D1F|nr:uncharacterized protein LOC114727369 isoform X2 [Prosopis alba]
MSNGERTRDATSPDPLDSFPPLRVRQSDRGDASLPSSSYSSCGESEFDRYCSANSVMGTPSVCSAITVFNDFPEYDFGSAKSVGIGGDNGLENFSLAERVEMNHRDRRLSTSSVSDGTRDFRTGFGSENIRSQQKLKYRLSGLEFYGVDNDELTMTMLDASSSMEINQLESNSKGGNGLENFNSRKGVEMNRKVERLSTPSVSDGKRNFRTGFGCESIRSQQNSNYGSSGLEFYGDDNDELTMTMLDASNFMGVNESDKNLDLNFVQHHAVEVSEGSKGRNEFESAEVYLSSDAEDNAGYTQTNTSSNVDDKGSHCETTVGEGGLSGPADKKCELDSFDAQSKLQNDEGVIEREQDRNSSNCEHSEGEDSICNYGGDDDNKNDYCSSRSIYHLQESEVQHENPLLINSSVAFGSKDLDDFLLENEGNGQVAQVFNVFQSQKEKNPEIDKDVIKFGSVRSTGISIAGQNEEGKDKNGLVMSTEKVTEIKDLGEPKEVKAARDFPAACCPVQGVDKVTNTAEGSSSASSKPPGTVISHPEDVREIIVAKNNFPETGLSTKADDVDLDPLADKAPQHRDLNVASGGTIVKENEHMNTEKSIGISVVQHVENPEPDKSKFKFDNFSESEAEHRLSSSTKQPGNMKEDSSKNLEQSGISSNYGMKESIESFFTSTNLPEKSPQTSQIENFEPNEFYDEVVHEMEEILLDSVDSPGVRLSQGNRYHEPQFSMPLRDGGLTASTSGTDDAYLLVQRPGRIDRIEVVGARQKRGDVSLSERLLGVKEYTVYKIKVWSSKGQWEVERRYRDFLTLHRQIKTLFSDHGWDLPLPWSSVEKESKKIFGSASPDVIVQRSVLIQECLQSILHTRFYSSPPSALIWFLSPQGSCPSPPASSPLVAQSSIMGGTNNGNLSSLGKTISLIVEIPPNKSMKQMLEAQHNTCAGCHKHFDDGKTLIRGFVETFGWGKPRICEYSGQLFCSSCHTNDTAVLPARVLHQWDFTQYPVSQLAKSYLDSIHDQPMLCVTAVNPFLLSKVPALLHVMNVRKKIRTLLPFVRCPFRRSIYRGLGTRRYLVESNDFFALRDLIDLSKGAFAALPVMVETLSSKILEHITDQCLVCCDVGVPCSARQDCGDPSSLIFPFQEDEIERCKACQSVFHKQCFRKLSNCTCGALLRLDKTRGSSYFLGRGLSYGSSSGFLSGLFTKEDPHKTRDHKDIILMGSLPSTSL